MAITQKFNDFLARHNFGPHTTPGTDLAVIEPGTTHTHPTAQDQAKKEAHAIRKRNFIFGIFLVVACVIVWIILFAIGMTMSPDPIGDPIGTRHLTYVTRVTAVLFWFNLVIMAYPAVKAFVYRQQLAVRLVIITASIVATMSFGAFGILSFMIYTLTPAWSAPIGYIAGVAALFFHAAAAYMLSLYKGKSTVKEDQETLERHDRIVKAAQEAADATAREENTATTLTEQRAVELARLQKVTTEAQTRLQEAQRRYDDSPLVKDLVAAKAAKAKADGDVQDLDTQISMLEDRIGKTDHHRRKTDMQHELDELIEQQQEVKDTRPDLTATVDKLTSKVEASSVAQNLNVAQKKYESALSDEEPSKRRYDDAEGKRNSAANANAIKQGVLQSTINERDEAKRKIAEAHKAQKNVVRDVIFFPTLFLVAAFCCYAGWNAWVQLEVAVVK